MHGPILRCHVWVDHPEESKSRKPRLTVYSKVPRLMQIELDMSCESDKVVGVGSKGGVGLLVPLV